MTADFHTPLSLSDVRSALEDRLIIILGASIPLISLCVCLVSSSYSSILMACLSFIAIAFLSAKNIFKPIQKYWAINFLTIGTAISLCLDFSIIYAGLMSFLMAIIFNVILRGTKSGIKYVSFCLITLIVISQMHSTQYLVQQTPANSLLFWCVLILITLIQMGIIVYSLGFVYKSLTSILTEIHLKNRVIQQMLETDKLTGLCNRWVAEERLKVILACQQRYGGITFVLFLDLDGFKAINDTYHHIAGDFTLKTVAKRLKSAMRPEDIVSRMGGDEFVIVVHIDDDDINQARKYIQDIVTRLLKSIAEPIIWENHSLSLGASIGIAEHAYQHPITAEELMHKADMEMFSIKRSGKMGGSMNGEKFTTI